MNFCGEKKIWKQVGKSLKGASLFIEFCDFFHFTENFNLTSLLGSPIIDFIVNFLEKILYDLCGEEIIWKQVGKSLKGSSVFIKFVTFLYFTEKIHLTSFLGD